MLVEQRINKGEKNPEGVQVNLAKTEALDKWMNALLDGFYLDYFSLAEETSH